jgi:hypothetical protein
MIACDSENVNRCKLVKGVAPRSILLSGCEPLDRILPGDIRYELSEDCTT